MFPCRFNLSTRSTAELAARKAIRKLEGRDIEDVTEYINTGSEKYKKMVECIAKDLEVTTLRYQTVEDMVDAIGLPKENLCLYCWTGQCPRSAGAAKKKLAKENIKIREITPPKKTKITISSAGKSGRKTGR
jgi:amidophosphoribosyltransferase